MNLQLEPLTPEAFAPYGQVLMGNGPVPEREAWAAQADNLRMDARANITYMSLEPVHYPVQVTELERHPFSHQIFVPLNGTRHLVLVCPSYDDGSPDFRGCLAFEATGGQSVNYNANVWHAPRMVLHESGSFIMLRWDNGTAADTELLTLDEPLVVQQP
jgi:ureidoglycolate lyase